MQNPKQVSLDIALSETCHVVTYNSTLGVEALRLGIPMLCSDKAHFSAVANSDRDTRKNYLDRLAYAQWKLPEIASGEAISYMLSQMK
jgi:capsule polysaccharide modification protein KpsS